jgi:HAD superfamily phosphatase (TIGR01668 family)
VWRWLRPSAQVATVYDIDLDALRARGIRGVILDLDNTIVPWGAREVSPRLPVWIAAVQDADFRLCIVSNNMGSRVTSIAKRLGLPIVVGALKPRRRALRRALIVMGTTAEATALVGDQLLTDILGGNRLGLHTILVRPQSRTEFMLTRLVRRFERFLLRDRSGHR